MEEISEILESYCETLDWSFTHGNKANQNLLESDLVMDKVYLLLDPFSFEDEYSEFGAIVSTTYTGTFLIMVKSDIDDTFENKYNENIRPLIQIKLKDLKRLLDCSDHQVLKWGGSYVQNVLDINGDGVIVTYSIKIV